MGTCTAPTQMFTVPVAIALVKTLYYCDVVIAFVVDKLRKIQRPVPF
jgi:hypothetical protein